jgi:hypothetical protein
LCLEMNGDLRKVTFFFNALLVIAFRYIW